VLHIDGRVCSTTYTVSQLDAGQILLGMSVERFASPLYKMLNDLYNSKQELKLACLTVLPFLFVRWRRQENTNANSDVS